MKITKFADIPQFTSNGNWQCNFRVAEVWRWVKDQERELGGIDLDPDFQRSHVWTEAQQIAWLEFFFRGGKTGRIYFNHPGWMRDWNGTLTLVDGKQRLEAIRRFMENEIPIFGSYRREFTDKSHRFDLEICVNNLKTRRQMIQWYIDMNAGGTPHTNREIDAARALLEKEPA
jgi:hypothetical protein